MSARGHGAPRGARVRAMAVLLALVTGAALARRACAPRPPDDDERMGVGIAQGGELRIFDLAVARRFAAERSRVCGGELMAPEIELQLGSAVAVEQCPLRARSLPLGARRVLGLASDPNALSAEDFEELRGIGPAIAARIVLQRHRLGGFKTMEDLRRVRGIGPARMAQLRAALNPVAP